jgi:hypothetical protein
MLQGLKEITVRLDATHNPVNYDRNFFSDLIRKQRWSWKLRRSGLNTTVNLFSSILLIFKTNNLNKFKKLGSTAWKRLGCMDWQFRAGKSHKRFGTLQKKSRVFQLLFWRK